MTRILRCLGAITALFAALLGTHAASAQDAPLRIGVITFLSGPAAGPFGVPAKNAADLMVETLNKGGQIPGYELGSESEIIQNSLWGGDLEAFILQAAPRGVMSKMPNIMITGETVFESVAGTVDMALGKGHQAVQHVPYGTVKKVDGKLTLINIKYYPPSQISPPDGMKSVDWIRSGFKR